MTIDMKNIVNTLPSCKRRIVFKKSADDPGIIYCRPDYDELRIQDPKILLKTLDVFKPKIISTTQCLTCSKNVPVICKPENSKQLPPIIDTNVIIYEKKEGDWEPPPLVPGYKRKSDNPKSKDAWVLIPDANFCIHAKLEKNEDPSCGCKRYQLFCVKNNNHILLLQLETCQNCPDRIEKP